MTQVYSEKKSGFESSFYRVCLANSLTEKKKKKKTVIEDSVVRNVRSMFAVRRQTIPRSLCPIFDCMVIVTNLLLFLAANDAFFM